MDVGKLATTAVEVGNVVTVGGTYLPYIAFVVRYELENRFESYRTVFRIKIEMDEIKTVKPVYAATGKEPEKPLLVACY